MSRFSIFNEEYKFVYGIDSLSVFIQVWSLLDDEKPMLVVDSFGIKEYNRIPQLKSLIEETQQRFSISRSQGNSYPNLDINTICRFARKLGFKNIDLDIYRNLD